MECPKCRHENPNGAKFCNECAAPLADNIHDDRFSLISDYVPQELKEKILEAGRQIESERRFVTVLFADVSGFTSLSEKLDPETVTMVMNDLFDGLISIIIKYEGLIIDFFGDGILAVFGAPLAHENDPERAIRSVLDMMPYIDQFNMASPHKLPAPLGIHAGIHSGLVVVGNVGNDLRMRYSAVGDTVNLCSRIADYATTGEIYISDNTFKLLPSQLKTEQPESIRVKGKDKRVTVHRLHSIKDEDGPDFITVKQGFVGRRAEKETILHALSEVLEKKEKRLLICGEPGVGKTRLKDELVNRSIAKGLSVFEGKCSSLETKSPYYLWNTILKDMFNISLESTEDKVKDQLHDALSALSMNAEEPYLAALLSLRYEEILLEDDQERKRKIFEAMSKLLDRFSRRQPTVFILEDLHWADRFSKELLEFLMKKDELAPALFCIIFRPEYTDYRNIMNHGQLINLDRLMDEDTLELIKLRLDVKSVPDTLHRLINKRTEGNPFFIEESLKALIENEFIALKRGKVKLLSDNLASGVPDTVQGAVIARIDRLEGKIRDVLLNASVIGREFSRRLVEKVINGEGEVLTPLNCLKGLELILEKKEVQEFEYLFKHYMVQEVAYNTILINKRKKLHGLIANAIEEIYEDRLKGLYEVLAFHYEKAEEWEKAAEYYGRAGRKFREMYTEDESEEMFNREKHAMEKIFESTPARGLFLNFIFKPLGVSSIIIFGILFVFVFFLTNMLGVGTLSRSLSSILVGMGFYWAEWTKYDLATFLIDISWQVFLIWLLLWVFFWLIIPAFQRIKLLDLMNDRIEIIKGDMEKHTIYFSDIKSAGFYGGPLLKKIYREVDPQNTMDGYNKMSVFRWLKNKKRIPYQIGFIAKKGGIYLRRKKGFNRLRIILPWLHALEKSQYLCLCPSEPREFFDQLYIAYEKWKRANAPASLAD